MALPSGATFQHEYRLLGRFEVRVAGSLVDLGPPKQRAVLAVLLLEANRVVSTDRLLELLWGDAPKALASLQSYVSNLRRVLEPHRRPRDPAAVLLTQAPGYQLAADRAAVDVLRFEDLVAAGRDRLRTGDPAGALSLLEEALGLWGGPPLPELGGEPIVVEAANRLGGVRVTALGLAAQARLDLGDHLGAVGLLEGPVAEHPLDERMHGLLALGLYRAGRQADALRMIDRVRRALGDTAGLEPGPELRELESSMLAQSAALDWQPTASVGELRATGPSGETAAPAPAAAVRDDAGSGEDLALGPAHVPESGTAMVGRTAELVALTEVLDGGAAGHGGAVVVVGEPGIGKTRLVEELAAVARRRNFAVAWVRCPEEGAIPPFWPAVQLAAQVREAGLIDAVLAPPEGGEGPTPPSTLFGLYEAVVTSMRRIATPVLLVLDDLQWADADSLRLLAQVASALATTPVVAAVTVRPVTDDSEPALLDALDALTRAPASVHLQLAGLGAAAVAEWLGRRTDVDVPAAVAATVHERTGGNPLFVKELSELLAAEGVLGDSAAVQSARAIPPGVQSVVRRRVARLPAPAQQLLSVASIVGRSFELGVVAAVAGEPLDAALDALAPALDAGVVLDEGTSGFRFSHALVAEALAAEINATRRARLHAATARALVERAGRPLGTRAALVAHHALEGVLAGTAELAVEASVEAARLAATRFGFEEAAGHWGRAVEALALARPADHAARIDALCELAVAGFHADVITRANDAALSAVELAEATGDTAAMGRAAAIIGSPHVWPNQRYGEVDPRAVATLVRAADAVDPADVATRALVLGALAVELTYAGPEAVEPARAEAEALARASGDPFVLARVLVNVIGPLGPAQLERRESIARELLELCAAHDLPAELELVARFQLALCRTEAADFDASRAHMAECRRLADRIGGGPVRAQLAWYEGSIAAVHGDYDKAVRLGAEAGELYRRTRRFDADLIELALDAAIAADRGGFDDLIPRFVVASAASPRYDRLSSEFNAWVAIEAGLPDVARAAVASIDAAAPFSDDYTLLCGASMGLQVRVELGDTAGAASIMAVLEPYRDRWCQAGSGGCTGGLADLALARGAALLGDRDRARALFADAVAGHERLRTPAWLARSLVHQGRFLLDAGDPDDHKAGRVALERARELAQVHGLPYVARQVGETLTAAP